MKKLLSILLVLVLCTSLMALTASAEGGYAISVSSHELKEGTKELTVTVSMTANDGVGALNVNPKYDASVLKLTACEWTEGIAWMVKGDEGAVYVDFQGTGGTSYTGTLVTMTFEVLAEEATNVGVTIAGATSDEVEVSFAADGGSVKFICLHLTGSDAVTTPATCETEGKIEYICKKCGETTDTETIAALGHTEGAAVTENEVAATCDKDGSKDTVVYCTVCNKEISRETETIAATGHKWDNGKVTGEAKCGEPGVMTYTCETCATTRTEQMDALAHILDEGVQTTAPTCTEKGVMTYTCTRGCGHTETEEIAALGHTEAEAVKEKEVAPTCTVAGGHDEVVYCSVCKAELSRKAVVVDALGHDWAEEGTVKTAATCYADGVMSYACNNGCGETKEAAITERPEHTVTKWTHEDKVYCVGTCDVAECGASVKERHNVKEYTQNEKGEYVGPCATCGQAEVNKGDMIPAGDITPMLVMGGVAVLSMLAAAAYVTSRKFAR